MAAGTNAPVIIKKVKKGGGDGHHGGAWKVAYADFVTAMMAFFLLMWLLSSASEQQKSGIADYFSPTIPLSTLSGGGDGLLSGDSVFSTDAMSQAETGGLAQQQGDASVTLTEAESAAESAKMEDLEEALLGIGGESMLDDNMQRHVVTRLTDEGLVIEIFDLPGASMFDGDTPVPTPLMVELVTAIGSVVEQVTNDIALHGHVRSAAIVQLDYRPWNLSSDRAATVRKLLEASGTAASRFVRQTGEADRAPVSNDPKSVRNNRIEMIVLRNDL